MASSIQHADAGTTPDRSSRDWLRGSPKAFAIGVLVVLLVLGAWHGRRGKVGPWSGVGAPVDLDAGATAQNEPLIGRLDLNTATEAELDLLPGIGPSVAARIVAYREQVRGFRSIDELGGVRGIGPRTLDRLRNAVVVSPEPVISGR